MTASGPQVLGTEHTVPEPRKYRYRWLWRLRHSPTGMLGAIIVVGVVLVVLLGSAIAPHDPELIDLKQRLVPPVWAEGGSTGNMLGTDQLGRDVLSRIILGTRVSLLVGIAGVALAMLTGVFLDDLRFLGRLVGRPCIPIPRHIFVHPLHHPGAGRHWRAGGQGRQQHAAPDPRPGPGQLGHLYPGRPGRSPGGQGTGLCGSSPSHWRAPG